MSQAVHLKQLAKKMLPASLIEQYRTVRRNRKWGAYQAFLRGKSGIEIGGPSPFFRDETGIYKIIAALDGVNFSAETIWEGSIAAGNHYNFALGRTGRQLIAEAADLHIIESGCYQFLISSNCLEHMANPLGALQEWIRVVESGGLMLLVLPNKDSNFDHRRPATLFEHLMDDQNAKTSEEDMTHLAEVLELHDLSLDPGAGDRENFIARCMENYKYRGMHHHVFDMVLIERMLSHLGVKLLLRTTTETDFIVLGRIP
jgi:SAM-dependent methyltransferase